jgi:hypothetical protein
VSSNLTENIEFELGQLHQLLLEGHALIKNSSGIFPASTDRWALGAMLQAFYNGIENIYRLIAVFYKELPEKSGRWHADLLTLMTKATSKRPAIVSSELFAILQKYLAFRHIIRSIYTHELRWESMADLVFGCEETLHKFENELRVFMEILRPKNPK